MGFLSKLLGKNNEFKYNVEHITQVNRHTYYDIVHFNNQDINKYNFLHQLTNSCLSDFDLFYQQQYKTATGEKNLCEVSIFLHSIIFNVLSQKGVSRKFADAIGYSIRQRFIHLEKEMMKNPDSDDFDMFFEGRGTFYFFRAVEIIENYNEGKGMNNMPIYSSIETLFMKKPLIFIKDNHPLNVPIILSNPMETLYFKEFFDNLLSKVQNNALRF